MAAPAVSAPKMSYMDMSWCMAVMAKNLSSRVTLKRLFEWSTAFIRPFCPMVTALGVPVVPEVSMT